MNINHIGRWNNMKIAVVGSRTFRDADLLYHTLKPMTQKYKDLTIVSGGARGADMNAECFADALDIPTEIYKPDWDKYGKSAGFKRNITIVDNSDFIVAFWDGVSRGTQHTINIAKKQNKPILIINYITKQKIKINY